jgi:hypothetical protein
MWSPRPVVEVLVLASPAAALVQSADAPPGATEVLTDDPEVETPPMPSIEAVAAPELAVPEPEPETEPEPVETADEDEVGSPVSVVEAADGEGQPPGSDAAREDADGPVATPIDEPQIAPPDPGAAEDAPPSAEDGA